MDNIPLLFSFLFFAAFAVYLFFGIYLIYINPRAGLNRVFFLICTSLCLWSFGFSMATSAPDIDSCLFWQRISALGWSTVYSMLLHFFLLLTDEKCSLKKRAACFLLYIPAVVSVYAFSISDKITSTRFNPVKMDYGWVSIAVQNKWASFFNIYYIGYSLACLVILKYWKRNSTDKNVHKQSDILFYSLLATFLLGILTDVVLNSYLVNPLPQMAPIFTLIPIVSIYYSMKRYKLMNEKTENRDELILSHETLTKYYYYLAIMLFMGALLSLLSLLMPDMIYTEANLKSTLFTGGLLFVLGIIVILLQFIKSDNIKNLLIMTITLSIVPIIAFRFIDYSGITVWAIPIILIMTTLVFNSRVPLFSITMVAIATQIMIWMYAPGGAVLLDEFDYILRIGMIVITAGAGLVINNVYRKRLKENIHQTRFQKIVSEISSDFVSISRDNIGGKINNMLKMIGEFFHVEQACVFLINYENGTVEHTHEWCSAEINSEMDDTLNIELDELSWLIEELKNNKLFCIDDTEELPEEIGNIKNYIIERNIKSLVLIPIEEDEEFLGFIGVNAAASTKKWSSHHIELLKILANLLADGLMRVKAEKEIEHMAYYDYLTGLPNRTLFMHRLNWTIYQAKQNSSSLGIIFIDLDSFKSINDTMGHSGGDTVINKVAKRLEKQSRKTDFVARFGGDEFLILLNNLSDNGDVTEAVDEIMGLFEKPFNINGQDFFVTCSAGVAVYPVDGEDADTLIKNADTAMYNAKSGGKNQYLLCTEDMKEEVRQNIVLTNNLYRVLERNELTIHYQPQIKLHTNKIIGMEALLRWEHPELGIIPPSTFIPLAESSSLINSIGEWVLRTACAQNKKWQDMGFPPLRMAVNLSIVQFNNPNIVNIIDGILKETGLDPEYLELEITESITIRDTTDAINTLNRLKGLGVSISIDDFGIEYSSLGRLKILPIDRIKIDMQFIQAIETSEKDKAITGIIINLAKQLNLEVIAEGVETASQLEFLSQRMCDDVQGYYFFGPMSAGEVEELLEDVLGERQTV